MITEPGVFDISAEEYHADPCPEPSLSSSGARQILRECPARFWHDRNNPTESSAAQDIGSLAHSVMLEGEVWRDRFEVLPEDFNGRKKGGKALKASIEDAGKTAIRHEDWQMVSAMVEALRAHELANAVFMNGKPEQAMCWKDPRFGIWRRSLLDWLPNPGGRIFADYKTCVSAHPADLRKAMFNYGYHQQAAFYLEGIKALRLATRPRFIFVFQEKKPPYPVTIVQPDDNALMWAQMLNDKAASVFAECLAADHWPGYSDDIEMLALPGFATNEYERLDGLGAFDIAARFQSPEENAA
jgi:hypothetical protein